MNIAHVIDSEGLYGAERVLLNLMEAQRGAGERPLLISLGDRGTGPKAVEEEARIRGLEVIALRFRNGPNPLGTLAILRHARQNSVRVIHSHGYKGDILVGTLPRAVRKIPVVSTLHGWTSTRAWTKMWIYEWAQVLALKNVDAVITVSHSLHNHSRLKRLGISSRCIPNGIPRLVFDPSRFPGDFPAIAEKCRGTFSVLSIGRLSAEKGYDLLVRACARLTDKGVNWSLVIMGDGECRVQLERMARDKASCERVHLTGYYPDAYRVVPFFRAFVLSSLTEGLPVTLLEAMQSGIPVAATAVGEIPRVLDGGRFGRLIAPADVEALAETLYDVYLYEERARQKAIAARTWVVENYGVENMVRQYGELYRTLLT